MAGTAEGSRKAVQTIYEKHGKDFFKINGALGGAASTTGGFWANRELARTAGVKGGKISRRGYRFVKESEEGMHYVGNSTGEVLIVTKKERIAI